MTKPGRWRASRPRLGGAPWWPDARGR
uniref:Uncharacterized protein n=1 Tax=Arundo donax TaxID=35708 RepID=A0A0A9A0X5_ARUDO